jgi:nucleotide-binding universal stress UspA family protein
MFKTIVLAADGSEGSKRTIPIAVELAKRDDAKIVLAHVDERIVGKGGGDIHPDEEQIQAVVKKLAEELSAQGIETSIEMADVMVGGPAHVIAEIADRVSADLIVTGTRGHSPVAGLLLGSVAQRLLHLAKQPVLVVPSA